MESLIILVKQKREFSGLPDSLVEKALCLNKNDVKKTRAFLRKYFGVFMTNKVLKGANEKVLENHISSRKRDYSLYYEKIKSVVGADFKSVLDFGCGANGFSYSFISKYFGKVNYIGVEATKQLCDSQNEFFKNNNFSAKVVWGDLFDLSFVDDIVKKSQTPRLILLLQVVDALENIEPNFSKKFILNLKGNVGSEDVIVISNPVKSISGRNKFDIKRRWLEEFIKDNFILVDKFYLFEEEFLIAKCI